MGLRSSEWNYLQLKDLEYAPEHVWVHAPNKRPAGLYMSDEVRRAYRLAMSWQAQYSLNDDPDSPAVVAPLCERSSVYTDEGIHVPRASDKFRRFDTTMIRPHLTRFYAKYFGLKRSDGRPVLYQDHHKTGEPVPFDLPFVDYRAVAITEYRRMEKNPEKLRLFARHESLGTTLNIYVRRTAEEVRDYTLDTLAPFSERVKIRVEGRIATPEELEAASEKQALVPGGGCGEALEGKRGCRRAIDCRLCSNFLIDPRRREFFVGDAVMEREKARRAEESNQMRSVQVHLGLAAINDAIVETIDLYQIGVIG